MRSICATLIALCLVTAGSVRAPQLDSKHERRTPTVDTAPVSVTPAVKLRRRALMTDAGLGPLVVAVVTFDLTPPVHALRLPAGPAPRAPSYAPNRPHSARGPPRA